MAQKKTAPRSGTGSADGRARAWAFVVPHDCKQQAVDYIRDNGLYGYMSPDHNGDVNANGTEKFDHNHIMLRFSGKKSLKQMREVAGACGAVNAYVKPIQSWDGYARYLVHMDNPEKHQYSPDDVLSFGGANWLDDTEKAGDDDETLREIMRFCDEHSVTSLYQLSMWAAENNQRWFRLITTQRTVFLSAFLRSMEWTLRQQSEAEEAATNERVRDAHAKAVAAQLNAAEDVRKG